MPEDAKVALTEAGWNALVKEYIETKGVAAMKAVADACNNNLDDEWAGGYKVSTEGDKPLTKRDYRATCITANWGAIVDNARNGTLLKNFYLAGTED